MKQRKQIVITLVIVMLAAIALSVNIALAAGSGVSPDTQSHPPVCYKVNSFAPGVMELQCNDVGKDIVNVAVKTNVKYELNWDSANVTLRVFPSERIGVAYWVVSDKAGNMTSGRLP